MNKICPIMSKVYVDTNGDWPTPQMHEVDCAVDRCAWWGFTAPDKGDCILGIIALQLNHISNK